MKNKIITNDGYAQFIFGDGSGKIIETEVRNVYSVFQSDTISFVLIGLPKSSGLALFTSRAEDLELNGVTYSMAELPDAVAEAFAPGGGAIHFEIVDELPEVGEGNVIYLVPSAESGETNYYTEYIWLESEERYEKIGTTDGAELNVPIWKDRNPGTLKFNHSGNKATAVRASAFGYETVASGVDSLVMGDRSSATTYSNCAFVQGQYCLATEAYTTAMGHRAVASGQCSFAQGMHVKATNNIEHSVGKHNVSHRASNDWGDSGNTLFSIGNGATSGSAHNALEVMQNGDIYLTLNGQDVRLQDHLASEPSSAVTSGDTNAVQGGAVYTFVNNKLGSGFTVSSVTEVIESNERVIANAINDIQENKQDKLIAGENITISGNVISAEGGESYSAGVGIDIDSANTITATYRGYLSYDNPQQFLSDYEGEFYIKAPWKDCEGVETGECVFFTAENTGDYQYYFSFNSVTKQYTVTSYPEGKENDWQDYFTITFDDEMAMFKVTTLQQIAQVNDNACTRFFRIGSGYNDYSYKYSGTTEDAFDGVIDNFSKYANSAYLGAGDNQITLSVYYDGGVSSYYNVMLDDLTSENGHIHTNIQIPTGVSGWTDIQFAECNRLANNPSNSTFRLSGDTSDLANFNKNNFDTSWMVTIDNYGVAQDSLAYDSNQEEFILNSSWFGEGSELGEVTFNYDNVANTITIAYPDTVSIYGNNQKVKISNVYNNNCAFGTGITKFEVFDEYKQPLVPYVQGKIDKSAIVTSITSGSTDTQVPSAKAVNDQMGGLKLMSISQAAYDALVTKDPNTLYIIND